MKIAVVGGGPGGLYFARLAKRAWPEHTVKVFEQNSPDATFGFGVTLGGSSLGRLAKADEAVADQLTRAMVFDDEQKISLNADEITLKYAKPGGSLARLELLRILQRACHDVDVDMVHDQSIRGAKDVADYDLIVAADGVNSTLRQERADSFGTCFRQLTNHFAWYGVDRPLSPNALVFRGAMGGRFIAHYYAYSKTMSTFVAECDEQTWVNSGLDAMSDAERREVVETIFAPELGEGRLVENRSIWRQFPVITNARWYDGNVVLLGDALRSAHFSIGSGTRLAMEDAVALFEACRDAAGGIEAALPLYVERRRASRDQFGEAGERSFEWYEQVALAMKQPMVDFAYDFLTRTGRVDDARLETYAPDFHALYTSRREAARASVI